MTYEEARSSLLDAFERQKTEKFVVVSTKALETLLFGEYGVQQSWGPSACDERVGPEAQAVAVPEKLIYPTGG